MSVFAIVLLFLWSIMIRRNYRYVGEWYDEEEEISQQTVPASAAVAKAAVIYCGFLAWASVSMSSRLSSSSSESRINPKASFLMSVRSRRRVMSLNRFTQKIAISNPCPMSGGPHVDQDSCITAF